MRSPDFSVAIFLPGLHRRHLAVDVQGATNVRLRIKSYSASGPHPARRQTIFMEI